MKYDFSSIMDRHGMDAIAVDAPGTIPWGPKAPTREGFDLIPMWVADMNFPTVPTIPEAIVQRTQHPAYGYFEPRAEYYEAIIRWHKERNGVEGLASKHIGYANGVLGGVVSAMNVLSMYALIGAYQDEGYLWLEELRQVLTGNIDFACDYITRHFEGVTVQRPQGTYMLFLDCTGWCEKHGKTIDDVQNACYEVGVCIQDGRQFHEKCHIRMNLALPLSRVQEAFRRMDEYVFNP